MHLCGGCNGAAVQVAQLRGETHQAAFDPISPNIMSNRRDDPSPEIALILKLIRQMYRDEGIVFGRSSLDTNGSCRACCDGLSA